MTRNAKTKRGIRRRTIDGVGDTNCVIGAESGTLKRRSAADGHGVDATLAQRRLGGREAGERHAERRAADVVEAELVAELDRARLAAVLAADPELQAGADAAA